MVNKMVNRMMFKHVFAEMVDRFNDASLLNASGFNDG